VILGVAVKLDQPVEPRQVKRKSNKFDWRHRPREYGQAQLDNNYDDTKPLNLGTGQQLTFTSLLLTCRALYCLLTSYPVFYEVVILLSSRERCRSNMSLPPRSMNFSSLAVPIQGAFAFLRILLLSSRTAARLFDMSRYLSISESTLGGKGLRP
jgi:hypothetical protein